ncbi:MAG: acetylglucosamine-6-sulfatase [Lentisphaerae bacterium]|nr:acetylglucosamine-6-sulfatase [Lentisphaerota bacterium]
MKFSLLLLAALIGIAPVMAAETPAPQKTQKVKAANKKKKAAPKLTLEQQIKVATTPVQYKRHVKRHAAKKAFAAKNKDKIKILMLGDSITHQWEYKPAAAAQKKYIAPYNVLNLGCGGDRTQHTIWIIEKSGILEMISPKLVTVMIGTNNRGDYRATVAGIKRILDGVQKRCPEAQILLYAIFPRGKDKADKRRIENEKVNAEIVKFCDGKKIVWVDIRKNFLTPEGVLEKSMMPDLLHPRTSKAYSIWGESLKPWFEKYGK